MFTENSIWVKLPYVILVWILLFTVYYIKYYLSFLPVHSGIVTALLWISLLLSILMNTQNKIQANVGQFLIWIHWQSWYFDYIGLD